MDHHLIAAIEKALDWHGPHALGRGFARGSITDPALCPRLLTPATVLDTIMRRVLGPPQLRCFQNGTELHPDQYLTTQTTRRGQALTMANMDRLAHLLDDGATLVLDALDTFDPTMEAACRALQWWSRELVQVNTYLTTRATAGFSLHWDDHDVLILQIAGEKTWEVRGASRPVPMYRDAEPNTQPGKTIVWSGTLTAGEVMHIPRGFWHQATRTGRDDNGFSLHVTFGFVQRTGVDWLSWAADRARELERFRHDLDRWGTPQQRHQQQRDLTTAVADVLSTYPPEAYLTAREQERPPHRHVATRGVFGPPTDVVCVTDFPPCITDHGDRVEVTAAGKQLVLAARTLPAVRLLLSGNPVNLAGVHEATGIDTAALAATLLREGLCAELTAPLSSGYTGLITSAP
ncbi:JmjC domain-containing protein [Kutzneria albida]|uniref:JmjC domain-containing protein n=1 Tax=Kutzneria albida DSM 43870 TaxID=1449976 RepID=W5WKK3_9PSEU|nr:cupin domain-containing protein [Kutzneria albida]AHH98684.1 hypothetical protein KALB_5322 [Kutzneria albida DSM 43870]